MPTKTLQSAKTLLFFNYSKDNSIQFAYKACALVGACGDTPTVRAVVQSSPEPGKPAWVAEMTELIRALAIQKACITQTAHNTHSGPMVFWGCGQSGHLCRDWPMSPRAQRTGSESAVRTHSSLSQPPTSQGGAQWHRERLLLGACCSGGLDLCWGLLSRPCHCGGGALLW